MRPIRLAANQPRRFYRGGPAIDRFRGLPTAGDHVPEDWVGSTTAILGAEPDGLTILDDGRTLRDAVAAEPEAFLGSDHVRRFGSDPALLVKLLDAGERLPVHAHPDDAFARTHLSAPWGKSEAWLIVTTEGGHGRLHLGFRDDVDLDVLAGWAAGEDAGALLGAMNEVLVAAGDCVYVPAGTPHSIGEGVFMVEVQQPSDLGVLLERSAFGLSTEDATMGLGLEVALGALRRTAVGDGELASWRSRWPDGPQERPGVHRILPPESGRFFRAEWLRPEPAASLEPAYAVLVTVAGAGRLSGDEGELELAAGDTVLVPHSAGRTELRGDVQVLRCLPPRPEAVPA